ncbi:MAG: deoxyribonuclease V [bacterium]|nr:deoxyribonuclease V [bacterium]
MDIIHRHDWDVAPQQAIALQKQMAAELIYDRPLDLSKIGYVAGVDVSVKFDPVRGHDVSQAAVVVVSFPDLQLVEAVTALQKTPFPYIPGLLSFREGPALEEAFGKLKTEPAAFIFDGMGRAHPRRIGIASHMGLWLNKPTIGCGKTLLTGKHDEPGAKKGSTADLVDKGEVIGVALRTRDNTKPVYISVGHLADLPTAVELVMRCTPKYRLPEPIRLAHNTAGQIDMQQDDNAEQLPLL